MLRLLLLLAVSTVPALAALVYVQLGLRHERMDRIAEGVAHQSRLMGADLSMLVDSAHQLTTALSRLASVRRLDPDCADDLAQMLTSLPGYAMLEVVADRGEVLCRSGAVPGVQLQRQVAAALTDPARQAKFRVGSYAQVAAGQAVLPMIRPFLTATGRHAAVVGAIDLRWLEQHVQRFRFSAHGAVLVADGDGLVLARLPHMDGVVGRPLPGSAVQYLTAPAGVATMLGLDGRSRLTGYLPPTDTGGLLVSYGVYAPDVLSTIDRAAMRGYVLVAVCALVSLLLMRLITRRMVQRPTEQLLGAVQRWRAGELEARAPMPGPEWHEFSRLAAAFNAMAETLQRRQSQLRELNASLEARVGERTAALSATNNRLLVEINERERTDAALRQSQKLQAVGQLAGGMAHEFNNLLTAVLGTLELLRVRLGATHALQRYVGGAVEAAERGARLTSQMLAFARRRRLMPIAVDLNAVIVEMRELLESSLGRSRRLVLTLDDGLGLAMADRHEIEAAILALVLNARDATGSAGIVKIRTSMADSVPAESVSAESVSAESVGAEGGSRSGQGRQEAGFVQLSVQDDGHGMTDHALAHAVDPFFTTKAPGQGAGLGLSQVHGMAMQLGGELRIDSRPMQGTSVALYLPTAECCDVVAVRHPCEPACSGVGRVLLVDDDDQVRQVASEMLRELGFEVREAGGGEAGLALLREEDAGSGAMLVADYAMPGMNGLDLIAAARKLHPSLPVLLITGYMDIDASGKVALGPREVLRKPFTLRQLSERIAELRTGMPAEAA